MTSIPNKLTKLVKECNNTIQKSIKMKPADISQKTHINFPTEFDTKILNLRLTIMCKSLKDIFSKGYKLN